MLSRQKVKHQAIQHSIILGDMSLVRKDDNIQMGLSVFVNVNDLLGVFPEEMEAYMEEELRYHLNYYIRRGNMEFIEENLGEGRMYQDGNRIVYANTYII